MIADLLEIAELTQQPIKKMSLNTNGVFEELKELALGGNDKLQTKPPSSTSGAFLFLKRSHLRFKPLKLKKHPF